MERNKKNIRVTVTTSLSLNPLPQNKKALDFMSRASLPLIT
jgi:hypothetical protein